MAAGEHPGARGHGDDEPGAWTREDLPLGTVVTSSGRVSAAEVYTDPAVDEHPFTPVQLARLDEALTLATRETGLRFSLYLGDLGRDPTETRVAELHGGLEGSARGRAGGGQPGAAGGGGADRAPRLGCGCRTAGPSWP